MSLEHAEVEQADWVGRYRTGRLEADEAAAFEEHLLYCSDCLAQLEADAELSQALRLAAAQDALRTSGPLAALAWLARLRRSRQAVALVGVALVALVLPLTWQQRRVTELTRERDDARAAAAGPASDVAAAGRARQQAVHEQALLAQQLEGERRSRAALAERLERALAPQANTPIMRLSPLRGIGGAPADRLHLRDGAGWVVLSLELPPADFPSYRVRLKRAGATPRQVLSQDDLRLDPEGSLSLAVHASMLVPGDYEATVLGLPAGTTAGRFSFRVE